MTSTPVEMQPQKVDGKEPAPSRNSDLGARLRMALGLNVALYAVLLFLVVMVILFAVTTPGFMTGGNWMNILQQTAPRLAAALAVTFVMTSGGIDLSTGSNVALSGSILALLIADGVSVTLAVGIVVIVGAALGAFQGWFVAYRGVFAFIVTLAGFYAFRGVALVLTDGYSVAIPTDAWIMGLGRGSFLGIPISVLVVAVMIAFSWYVFNRTKFGRYVVAVGSNKESLRRSGVNVKHVLLGVYIFSGVFSAVAGLMIASRLASGSSNAGMFFELEVITVVVLGGTALFGGRGSIMGTVIGALVFGVILNGMVLMGVSAFWVQVVQGAILLAAVTVNAMLDSKHSVLRS